MASNSTSNLKECGPVTLAMRTMRAAEAPPWHSDGSDRQEWAAGAWEAQRAVEEGFSDRAELLSLADAAHGGPVRFAQRMRETEWGGGTFPRRQSLAAFFAFLFGDECPPDGVYAQAYTAHFQAIRPFIERTH